MMNKYGYTYIYIIHEQLFRVYLKRGYAIQMATVRGYHVFNQPQIHDIAILVRKTHSPVLFLGSGLINHGYAHNKSNSYPGYTPTHL